MFEMVSPYNRVVIEYPEPKLYYLGCRDLDSHLEESYVEFNPFENGSTGFAVFVLRRFVCEKTFVLKKETYVIIDNMIILFIVSWFVYWCWQFVF